MKVKKTETEEKIRELEIKNTQLNAKKKQYPADSMAAKGILKELEETGKLLELYISRVNDCE